MALASVGISIRVKEATDFGVAPRAQGFARVGISTAAQPLFPLLLEDGVTPLLLEDGSTFLAIES